MTIEKGIGREWRTGDYGCRRDVYGVLNLVTDLKTMKTPPMGVQETFRPHQCSLMTTVWDTLKK